MLSNGFLADMVLHMTVKGLSGSESNRLDLQYSICTEIAKVGNTVHIALSCRHL
jgi:hypothetical protein